MFSEPVTAHPDRPHTDNQLGSPVGDCAPNGSMSWPGAVPPGIDNIAPGPELLAWLSVVDPSTLSGHDRVSLLRAHSRLISHFHAQMYRDMMAVKDVLQSGEDTEDLLNAALAAEAEIRAALSWSRRRTEHELSFAIDLESRHPCLLAALENGDIDVARAKVIDSGTSHLPHDAASSICATVLREAEGLTVGQIRDRVRMLAISTEPDEAKARFEEAHEQRRVVVEATTDGTAHVHAMDLAPDAAQAVARRISRLARRTKTTDDRRTPDQLRADVFTDLLLGREAGDQQTSSSDASGHRSADVEVRVDLTTLIGLDERNADISGYGPVVSDIAREVAGDIGSRWRFTLTDSRNGHPVASGPIRRRPTAA